MQKLSPVHWVNFIANDRTHQYNVNLLLMPELIVKKKTQIDASFPRVCPVIDHEFYHILVKEV